MKSLLYLILGIMIISSASALDISTASVSIQSKDTVDEKLVLNYNEGEIDTILLRYSPNLKTWDNVKGTFFESKNGKIKFGAIDALLNTKETAKYKYIFSSTNPTYEKEGWYYFYNGNEKDVKGFVHVDLRDICLKELANCSIKTYKINRLFLKDTYYLEVEFTSNKYIDPSFAGGDGTSVNPYQITNWTALNEIRLNYTAYYILMNNLSSETSDYAGIGNNWLPIGNSTSVGRQPIYSFAGTFDGQNYTISNLNSSTANSVIHGGLFGYARYHTIKNIRLTNCYIKSSATAGGILGSGTSTPQNLTNVYVENCTIYGTKTGGVVGVSAIYANYLMSVNNSVYGTDDTGGVIGSISSLSIYNSYSTGGLANSTAKAGGFVGFINNPSAGTVQNCYSTTNATGATYVGGFVGWDEAGNIYDAFAGGKVTGVGTAVVGGFSGQFYGAFGVNNSYWDINTTGQTTSQPTKALQNATGYTTLQMQDKANFPYWNIAETTTDLNNGYPYLAFQNKDYSSIWLIFKTASSNCWYFENEILVIPNSCETFKFSDIFGSRWIVV